MTRTARRFVLPTTVVRQQIVECHRVKVEARNLILDGGNHEIAGIERGAVDDNPSVDQIVELAKRVLLLRPKKLANGDTLMEDAHRPRVGLTDTKAAPEIQHRWEQLRPAPGAAIRALLPAR